MFGYVVADIEKLGEAEKERYQQAYCGLCHQLQEKYGGTGRITLTYDMTFLSILLSSLYKSEEHTDSRRCPIHPISSHDYWETDCTEYAADMNILLAYYNCIDDWSDDKSRRAKILAGRLRPFIDPIRERWPRQSSAVEQRLSDLAEMEKRNELSPDAPVNCFGALMGELFVIKEDEYSPVLRRMGAALGRYIYLLDAVCDLRSDIKKQKYNPLIAQMDTDFAPILKLMIGECTMEFEALPLERDIDIMRNILYSGVWVRSKRKKEDDESE